MTEIPEHLRERAEEARAKAAAAKADGQPAVTPETGFDTSKIPAHLLERARAGRVNATDRHAPKAEEVEDWRLATSDSSPSMIPAPDLSEQHAAPEDDGYSNVSLGFRSLWFITICAVLLMIPLAALVGGFIWFLAYVVASLHRADYLEIFRWTYVGGSILVLVIAVLLRTDVSVRAERLGVPRKAMCVAIQKYDMHMNPEFYSWDAKQLLDQVRMETTRREWDEPYGRPLVRSSKRSRSW